MLARGFGAVTCRVTGRTRTFNGALSHIVIVEHWFEELRRLVRPTDCSVPKTPVTGTGPRKLVPAQDLGRVPGFPKQVFGTADLRCSGCPRDLMKCSEAHSSPLISLVA